MSLCCVTLKVWPIQALPKESRRTNINKMKSYQSWPLKFPFFVFNDLLSSAHPGYIFMKGVKDRSALHESQHQGSIMPRPVYFDNYGCQFSDHHYPFEQYTEANNVSLESSSMNNSQSFKDHSFHSQCFNSLCFNSESFILKVSILKISIHKVFILKVSIHLQSLHSQSVKGRYLMLTDASTRECLLLQL